MHMAIPICICGGAFVFCGLFDQVPTYDLNSQLPAASDRLDSFQNRAEGIHFTEKVFSLCKQADRGFARSRLCSKVDGIVLQIIETL